MISLLLAALLPAQLDLPAPFPHVLTDAPTISAIAPGVDYGEYDLFTDKGPIVVHAIAVAPRSPDIALRSVISGDMLTSPGETVSSMARRTGAIAGINGDYFDINATNRPTNIVVRDGALLHTPLKRYALIVTTDGLPQIVENEFTGTVTVAGHTVTLDGINEMPPPDGGTSIVTPVFGPVAGEDNLTLVALAPQGGTPPFCTYRVTGIADNTVRNPAGYYLAIGLNAYGSAGVPNPGDEVSAAGDLSPIPLAKVSAAVGGGPLLLDGGAPVIDPDGPNGPEFLLRIPTSGAAIAADGTLYLLQVDGREPDHSIGVTRPEFAALMRAFGAVRGMAFDGGGSSEVVARTPTQLGAVLKNDPSDGHERKVADGLFVYDVAPPGAPSQIVAAPHAIHAMPGAQVPLRVAFADASDRVVAANGSIAFQVVPADLGSITGNTFEAARAGSGAIVVRSGTFEHEIPVEVTGNPARMQILPQDPVAPAQGSVQLQARAFDERGYALALPPALPWRALHGSVESDGTLVVGKENVLVSLLLGDRLADAVVYVGFHDVPLSSDRLAAMTVPRGADASVQTGTPCAQCDQLTYALGPQERAAYLVLETPLPQHAAAIAFDLYDGGGGGRLRIALRNAINEEVLLTVGELDHPGWRTVEVRLPATLAQPARLSAIYVIGKNATDSAHGSFAIRNLHAVTAGAPDMRP